MLFRSGFAALAGFYLFYRVSQEEWWCLRFLLPATPLLILAALLGVEAIARRWTHGRRRLFRTRASPDGRSLLESPASPEASHDHGVSDGVVRLGRGGTDSQKLAPFRTGAALALGLWAIGNSVYWCRRLEVFRVKEHEQIYLATATAARQHLPAQALEIGRAHV